MCKRLPEDCFLGIREGSRNAGRQHQAQWFLAKPRQATDHVVDVVGYSACIRECPWEIAMCLDSEAGFKPLSTARMDSRTSWI